ncbi:MAG: TerB family tellurite resistance protein [Bacteroidetes bacterium]|nr:TerB family tellurite resistance protein [Bacteroidota bacterium]
MKFLATIFFLILLALPSKTKAQEYEIERLILDIEKLAQLKDILNDLYKGYEILSTGYNTIKNISEGNFNLHDAFLNGLLQVNPVVRNYKKAFDIVEYQAKILSEYKRNFSKFRNDKNFTAEEIVYMADVYNNLNNESLKDLENLLNILTAGKMRMSDDERIRGIDKIYDHVKEKLMFLRHFNSSAAVLSVQRGSEQRDAESSRKLYGF